MSRRREDLHGDDAATLVYQSLVRTAVALNRLFEQAGRPVRVSLELRAVPTESAPAPAWDGVAELAEYRRRLWVWYQDETNIRSAYRLCEARGVPFHSRDFRRWLAGELAPTSATAIAIENFLRERRRPGPVRKDGGKFRRS